MKEQNYFKRKQKENYYFLDYVKKIQKQDSNCLQALNAIHKANQTKLKQKNLFLFLADHLESA